AHDYLFAIRSGKVSAELDIASIDLASRSFLVTKNSETPLMIRRDADGDIERLKDSGGRIGLYRRTRPKVLEFPLAVGSMAILVSDGVAHAGSIRTSRLPLVETARHVLSGVTTAQQVADGMLEAAIEADRNRPADDLTVVVLRAFDVEDERAVRRMAMSFPVSG
ncbi:MAG TPA: SpoIIE family protein phosphatase, partial [Thermomicrobiaceae bacterium]|nr:SpoIIE family protein phosphatase [Thermomicrobiaceae bacterium]